MTIPKTELEMREAVNRERKMWEDEIFAIAKRVKVPIKGLSAGQVLHAIAKKLLDQGV